jgi:hypothetical protein
MRYSLPLLLGATFILAGCSARAGVVVEPRAGIVESGDDAPGTDRVWVCHQGRWQEVAAPAAGGHSRHGDRVSSTPRQARASC